MTDWNEIGECLRERVKGVSLEGTHEEILGMVLGHIAHSLTVLALEAAERMVQAIEDREHDDAIRAKAKATADAPRGPTS